MLVIGLTLHSYAHLMYVSNTHLTVLLYILLVNIFLLVKREQKPRGKEKNMQLELTINPDKRHA